MTYARSATAMAISKRTIGETYKLICVQFEVIFRHYVKLLILHQMYHWIYDAGNNRQNFRILTKMLWIAKHGKTHIVIVQSLKHSQGAKVKFCEHLKCNFQHSGEIYPKKFTTRIDCIVLRKLKSLYTRKNAQVATGLQTSCNKSVHKLLTRCIRTACSEFVGTSLQQAVDKL